MKLVIHIGLPKAGSTTLQRLLSKQRESLRGQGTLVPRIGYREDKSDTTGHTPGHDLLGLLATAPTRLRKLVCQWIAEAEANGCSHVLASTENLTHPDNLKDLSSAVATIRSACSQTSASVKFVLIDRSDQGWSRSFYNELILDGRTLESRLWTEFESHLEQNDVSATSIKSHCRQVIGEDLVVTAKLEDGLDHALIEIAGLCDAEFDQKKIDPVRASPSESIVETARLHNQNAKAQPLFNGRLPELRVLVARSPAPVRNTLRRVTRLVLARTTRVG